MFRSIFFSVLVLFGLSGCQPVLKMIYGVKKPKPKTDLQVMQYANKVFDRECEMFRPIDLKSVDELRKLNVKNVPDILFFDSNGIQKSIHEDAMNTCTASADNFIKQLDLLNGAPEMALKKTDILQHIKTINSTDTKDHTKEFKNSIVIIWADWIGPKLNKQKTADWIRVYHELDQEAQDDIDLIIVNLDLLEEVEP